MLTERKLSPFEIKLIRQLDQRYFYVLINPNGVVPSKYLDQKQVDNDVAGMLRALRSMKAPGMVELPKPGPVQVPALTFKSSKSK